MVAEELAVAQEPVAAMTEAAAAHAQVPAKAAAAHAEVEAAAELPAAALAVVEAVATDAAEATAEVVVEARVEKEAVKAQGTKKRARSKVTAIKFNGEAAPVAKQWSFFWADCAPTHEPVGNLSNSKSKKVQKVLANARERPGKRIKFTGARKEINPVQNLDLQRPIQHQSALEFCARNALMNFVALPSALVILVTTEGAYCELTTLGNVVNHFQKVPCQLHKIKVENTNLLNWLRLQTTGMFLVEFDGHVVGWDANKSHILETDPRCPFAAPINEQTLDELGIKHVEKAFRVVLCGKGVL